MDKAEDEERGKAAGDGGAAAPGIALDAARAGCLHLEWGETLFYLGRKKTRRRNGNSPQGWTSPRVSAQSSPGSGRRRKN
jgi:hypothetical protein